MMEIENSDISLERLKDAHIERLAKIAEESGLLGIGISAFEKELTNRISYYKVAVCGEIPIGFIGIWNIAGECDIIDIAVDIKYRRRGVAYRLMQDVIGYCRDNGYSAIHLEVRESNFAAISLYEKAGFKRVGFREKYYSDGENAVLMTLFISGFPE